jgi:hypothetical protein
MTFRNKTYRFLAIGSILISSLLITSCAALQGVRVENDVVRSSKRYKANFTYIRAQERYTPLVKINQTVVKEVPRNSAHTYKIYDIVMLRSSSFRISDEVYIIVDNNPFRVNVENIYSEMVTRVEESKGNVTTSDSTSISVVTGYNEYQQRVNRIEYNIDNSTAEQIKSADRVFFRYYAGPDMITVRLNGSELRRLKNILRRS